MECQLFLKEAVSISSSKSFPLKRTWTHPFSLILNHGSAGSLQRGERGRRVAWGSTWERATESRGSSLTAKPTEGPCSAAVHFTHFSCDFPESPFHVDRPSTPTSPPSSISSRQPQHTHFLTLTSTAYLCAKYSKMSM